MASSKLPGDKLPSGKRAGQLQQFTPEAMELYKQSFSHVGPDSYLSKLASGDQSFYNEMEAPAMRQFSGLQGNMASRYSGGQGQGGMGQRKSSGFQNEMTAASSNFAQDLQSRRQQLQQGAIKDLMSMSHQLMNEKPYERFTYDKPQKQGFNWGGLGGAAVGGVGGFFLGGPAGAMSGAQMGYGMGSSLSGYEGGGGGGGGFQSTPGWTPGWGGQGGGGMDSDYATKLMSQARGTM